MTLYEAVTSNLDIANREYDIAMARNDIFMEDVMSELAINKKKAELKVIQESGTYEDLLYLEEEAGASAGEKIKAAIDHIIETLVEWFNKLKIKVVALISKIQVKAAIKKIEDKIKFNPFIRSKKIKVKKTDALEKMYDKILADYQKAIAKAKATGTAFIERLHEIDEQIDEVKAKRLKEETRVGEFDEEVTVETALDRLRKATDKIGETITGVYKDKIDPVLKSAKEAATGAIKDGKSDLAAFFRAAAAKVSRLGREFGTLVVDTWRNLFAAIKAAVAGLKEKVAKALGKDKKGVSDADIKDAFDAVRSDRYVENAEEEVKEGVDLDGFDDLEAPSLAQAGEAEITDPLAKKTGEDDTSGSGCPVEQANDVNNEAKEDANATNPDASKKVTTESALEELEKSIFGF